MSSELYIIIITNFKQPRKELSPAVFHLKSVNEGKSLRQIATDTVSSKECVRAALRRNNIPLRERGQYHGNPAQFKYGMKRKSGKEIEHKSEARVGLVVRQMQEEGLSLRGIARFLDQMKVPTKNRGKKWHPEMVRRLAND